MLRNRLRYRQNTFSILIDSLSQAIIWSHFWSVMPPSSQKGFWSLFHVWNTWKTCEWSSTGMWKSVKCFWEFCVLGHLLGDVFSSQWWLSVPNRFSFSYFSRTWSCYWEKLLWHTVQKLQAISQTYFSICVMGQSLFESYSYQDAVTWNRLFWPRDCRALPCNDTMHFVK